MSSSSTALRDMQRDLEARANDLAKIQKEIAKNHQLRKKFTIQLGENELVLKELDLLEEEANVYKLIGPVLVKQDLAEANANVRKRIEYISAELSCCENMDMQCSTSVKTRNGLMQLSKIMKDNKTARGKHNSPNIDAELTKLKKYTVDVFWMMKLQQRLQAGKAKA
ncbi:hypothetical protein Bca101_055486 [Brassica carinata]